MTRVLIYEPSAQRLGEALSAFSGIELLTMRPDGVIVMNGAEVSAEDARPEGAWLNPDLFGDAPIRDYLVAVLKSPALKWVQSGAAGFDNPVFGQIVAKGARLTTNHAQAVGMSEYVLAGVLDHFQRGPERRAAQGRREWARLNYREIAGTHWLVVGFGAIGQATAAKARVFGARVTGVRRSAGSHPDADAMASPDQLPDLLPEADVVVLSLPLSARTAGMVDAAFLAAMKPGSVLVNVGRGGLVDEAALLAALDAGKPEHAVLDVFHQEPLPEDSPFWTHPRVFLTAHASPLGSGLTARGDALFVENLRRYLAGEPLKNEASAAEVTGGG